MFLIMFRTGHALLLPGGRFLRPRTGRGENAEQSRNISDSWTQTRLFHKHGQIQCRTWTRIIRVREQSTSVFHPRPQMRQLTVRIHEPATDFTVRKQELAANKICPQSVHRPGLSTPANLPQIDIGRIPQQAVKCPCHRISVAFSLPTSFPVQIQIIPTYVLI